MMILRRLFSITIAFWFVFFSQAWSQERHLADILIQAETEHLLIPVLSLNFPEIDVDMAYNVQKAYIGYKLTTEKLAGFKAGLTSQGGQKQFGVGTPVTGVLFDSGRLTGEASVDLTMYHQLMIETEIGFVLGTTLKQPVPDTATLRNSIRAVTPVIELPDLGFSDMTHLKGVDIIAANVSSKNYIVGEPKTICDANVNGVTVSLFLGEQKINQGEAADAMGDQWQAALWLVNMMIKQGWTLEPGHLILTGALGKMVPGKPGKYVADYGDLGLIEFEIK